MSVTEVVSSITARRWLAICRALDMTVEEITSNPVAILIAACNEKHRAEHGRDAWDRFLDSQIEDLSAELGLGGDDDDSKSASA